MAPRAEDSSSRGSPRFDLPVRALDVLVHGCDEFIGPIEPPLSLGRVPPNPHLHENIIRTYVRSVKDFEDR